MQPLRDQIATRLRDVLAAISIAGGYQHDLDGRVFVHGAPSAALDSPHVVVVVLRWRPGTINTDVAEEQVAMQVQAWARWNEAGIETATGIVARLLADAEQAIAAAGDTLGMPGIVHRVKQEGGALVDVVQIDSDLAAGQIDLLIHYRYRRGNPYEAVA